MFLRKMVNEFIDNINNSNQQQLNERLQDDPSKPTSSNYKTCKKSSRGKKSYTKKYYNDETDQLTEASTKKELNWSERSKNHSKNLTPTKVKSGSWKRSEKSIAPFNALTNKKQKTLHKKSPNWLVFSNSKTKKIDPNQLVNGSQSASTCRPGTLYSDVLFGAGCSNLVKIKNCITPRFCNSISSNAAQKKLTKALFKFNGNKDNETSDESEVEGKKTLFPALQKSKNKFHSPNLKNVSDNFGKTPAFEESISNTQFVNTSTPSPTKDEAYKDADVVILSDLKRLSLAENNISYGNYLEQQFQHVDAAATKDKKFLISSISNIPKWNYMSVETGSSDGFPKFLCQFDDENYLKAEKMALLGLKLALGN